MAIAKICSPLVVYIIHNSSGAGATAGGSSVTPLLLQVMLARERESEKLVLDLIDYLFLQLCTIHQACQDMLPNITSSPDS